MSKTENAYESLIRGADELVNENAVLYNKVLEFDDAVHALRLLHDETHNGAFSFCDNEVCKLFREWE